MAPEEIKARLELLAAEIGMWQYDPPGWREKQDLKKQLGYILQKLESEDESADES